MTRSAVVHIGTEKTGTTTIQHFLRLNRARLAEQGIGVPETLGPITHTWLATFAELGPPGEDDGEAVSDAVKSERRKQFEDEMAALPAGIARVMFSSEHLHRRLETLAEVRRLRDLLAAHFDAIRIVVYLRRQDRLAASLYSTKIRYGASWDLPVLPGKRMRDSHYYNYRVLLEKYIEVFGRANVAVRIFEKPRLADGDVLRDYCQVAGIDFDQAAAPDVKNPSLSAAALMVLGTLNERAPKRGEVLIKEHFIRILEQHFTSSQQIAPRQEAVKFAGWFRDSNAWVRETFFPELAEGLFDEDFSAYPDQERRVEPTLREALAVFASMWDAQRAQRRTLLQRVHELEVQLHQAGLGPQPGGGAKRGGGQRAERLGARNRAAERTQA